MDILMTKESNMMVEGFTQGKVNNPRVKLEVEAIPRTKNTLEHVEVSEMATRVSNNTQTTIL